MAGPWKDLKKIQIPEPHLRLPVLPKPGIKVFGTLTSSCISSSKVMVWTFYGGWLGSVLLLSISLKKTITVGCDFDTTQAALLRAAPCFWKVLKCLWITVSGLGVHVVHWALGALIFTKIGKLCPLIFISNPLGESLKTREGIKPGFGQLYSSGPPIARWTNAQALSFALSSIQLPCPTWRATRCRGDACLDFCLSPRHACLYPTLSPTWDLSICHSLRPLQTRYSLSSWCCLYSCDNSWQGRDNHSVSLASTGYGSIFQELVILNLCSNPGSATTELLSPWANSSGFTWIVQNRENRDSQASLQNFSEIQT